MLLVILFSSIILLLFICCVMRSVNLLLLCDMLVSGLGVSVCSLWVRFLCGVLWVILVLLVLVRMWVFWFWLLFRVILSGIRMDGLLVMVSL